MSIRARVVAAGVIAAWGAVMVVTACSSSTNGGSSGSSGTSSGTSGTSGTSGGPDDGGGLDAVAGLKGGGALNLYSAKTLSTLVGAFAPPAPDAGGITPGCTIEPIGACRLVACTTIGDAGSTKSTPLSVGTITVTGGLIPGGGISMPPGPDGYAPINGPGNLWVGGESLTFAASGGSGIPAFSTTAVAPTAGLSLSSPVVTSGSGLVIPRSADFVMQWAAGASPSGVVTAQLGSTGSSGATKSLSCTFDVPAGGGTIPSATLGRLDAGPGSLVFSVFSNTTKSVADLAVQITLVTPIVASGEELTFVNATLQ